MGHGAGVFRWLTCTRLSSSTPYSRHHSQLMPHVCIRVLGQVLPQEDPRISSLFGIQSQECREGPGRMGKIVTQAVPVSKRAQSRLVA